MISSQSAVRALSAAGLALVYGAAAGTLWILGDPAVGRGGEVAVVVTTLGFGTVGSLLAVRVPSSRIGWLLLGFALTLGVRSAAEQAVETLVATHPTASRWVVAGILALEPIASALLASLAVLFPGGRVPGRRWWGALRTVWVLAGCGILLAPFGSYEGVDTASSLVASPLLDGIRFLLFLPVVVVLVAGMARIVRLRVRGSALERLQIRWVSFVLAVTLALLGAAPVWTGAGDIASFTVGVGVPLAIGLAVARYRLYDIDRLISRTVSYALVLAVLGAVFGVLVVGPTLVLGSGVGEDGPPSWVVAGSTLAVFALFAPLRRRVQVVVDRRFDRSRYDAQQVVEGFGSRVQDLARVEEIMTGVEAVAIEALRPGSFAVWIRESTRNDSVTPS